MENQKSISESLRSFFRWNRTSYTLFSAFLALIGLIIYVWQPLAAEYLSYIDPEVSVWKQLDYLLIGIFLGMTILIMANANLKRDLPLVVVGLAGGLIIEAWGTQTEIWFYYTQERPPLWIIPAWPIAALSIDRLSALAEIILKNRWKERLSWSYWLVFGCFLALMVVYVSPTFSKSMTIAATLLCFGLVLTPTNKYKMVSIFLMGAALGYFLELWGTTRECWTYYTLEQPPVFAVFAHGMASVAFWRAILILQWIWNRLIRKNPGNNLSENSV